MKISSEKIKEMRNGDAELWKITVHYSDNDAGIKSHYVVSSIASPQDWTGRNRVETFLFRSSSTGEILCWSELPGSITGEGDHEQAILNYCNQIKDGGVDVAADTVAILEELNDER